MRPDAYTKAVLTVIAACLLWLCALSAGLPLSAQSTMFLSNVSPQPVVIVGSGTIDDQGHVAIAMIRDRAGQHSDPNVPVKLAAVPAGPLDVRLSYTEKEPMPVGLTRVKPAAEWEPIRSAAEPEPTRPKPGGR